MERRQELNILKLLDAQAGDTIERAARRMSSRCFEAEGKLESKSVYVLTIVSRMNELLDFQVFNWKKTLIEHAATYIRKMMDDSGFIIPANAKAMQEAYADYMHDRDFERLWETWAFLSVRGEKIGYHYRLVDRPGEEKLPPVPEVEP